MRYSSVLVYMIEHLPNYEKHFCLTRLWRICNERNTWWGENRKKTAVSDHCELKILILLLFHQKHWVPSKKTTWMHSHAWQYTFLFAKYMTSIMIHFLLTRSSFILMNIIQKIRNSVFSYISTKYCVVLFTCLHLNTIKSLLQQQKGIIFLSNSVTKNEKIFCYEL